MLLFCPQPYLEVAQLHNRYPDFGYYRDPFLLHLRWVLKRFCLRTSIRNWVLFHRKTHFELKIWSLDSEGLSMQSSQALLQGQSDLAHFYSLRYRLPYLISLQNHFRCQTIHWFYLLICHPFLLSGQIFATLRRPDSGLQARSNQ